MEGRVVDMSRRIFVVGIAGAMVSVGLVTGTAVAAPDIDGKFTNPRTGMSVLLVGNDGTSVSAKVNRKGTFRLKPGRLTTALLPKRQTGPTLHLVRNGRYVGPVLLAAKNRRTGYLRLGPRRDVSLGKLTVKKTGYVRLARPLRDTFLDTRRTVRLIRGVPLGAGNQGLVPSAATTALDTARVRAAAGSTLPAGASDLGSDADQDGVPNVADVDMNGDGVVDAAQADSALQRADGGVLSGTEVLAGRPRTVTQFAKILDTDPRGAAINSHRNPGLTWTTLRNYLRDNLHIEALMAPGDVSGLLCDGNPMGCAEARSLASVLMDCTTLSYCMPGSDALIIAQPETGLDRQPLSRLLDSAGRIQVPLDTHGSGTQPYERGFQLAFAPKVDEDAGLQFAGDTFQFTALDGDGGVLARQVKVLTSSVATPPEWSTVAGAVPGDMATSLTPEQLASLEMRFFRPQRLASLGGDRPDLVDRGGLQYEVYVMGTGPGSFYWCRSSQVSSAHPDLVKVKTPGPAGRDEPLYDTDVTPAPGVELGFRLDVAGCLADPASGPGTPPASGTVMTIEMESEDSDGNRTRSQFRFLAP